MATEPEKGIGVAAAVAAAAVAQLMAFLAASFLACRAY